MEHKYLLMLSIGFWAVVGVILWAVFARVRYRGIVMLVFLATSALAFEWPIGYGYFRYACETQAGRHIYKNVPADGYVAEGVVEVGCGGGSCGFKLAELYKEGKAAYMEGKVILSSTVGLSPTKGLYRFYLADMNTSDCDYYKNEFVTKRPLIVPAYLPEGMCIAGKEIDEFSAKYHYVRKQDSALWGGLRRDRATFVERASGELLAEATVFRYNPGFGYRLLSLLHLVEYEPQSCGGGMKKDFYSGIVNDTFLSHVVPDFGNDVQVER